MANFRKVVGGVFEVPPATLQRTTDRNWFESLVRFVLRPLWGWRIELAAVAGVLALWMAGASRIGPAGAGILLLVMAAGCLGWPPSRQRVAWILNRARLRRRWGLAVRHAGLATVSDRIPRPVRIEAVPAGEQLRVRIPAGSTVDALADKADAVAAFLRVQQVRVVRDGGDAGRAAVTVVRRDTLAGREPMRWPNLDAARLSLAEPIPIGIDEAGRVVSVVLPERHVVIGGEPGGGKSVLVSMLVATAAMDPSVRLTLFDGKLVELAVWRRCADRVVGNDVADAIDALKELQADMDERYRFLLDRGLRKLDPSGAMPLRLVVFDELAFYLTMADQRSGKEFTLLLRDLVARGRAAGIIVVAATQKPSGDTVPTSLRDLMGSRIALRCSTRDASDTILGAGWAAQGYSASSIDAACRGVGFVLHEGGQPTRMKAFYLSDDDLRTLATRAEGLRAHDHPDAHWGLVPVAWTHLTVVNEGGSAWLVQQAAAWF